MNNTLELKSISKSFDGIRAVNNVSFAIEKEKVTSLIGPNGAGKTTLFDIITGFTMLDKGSVHYKNENITHLMPYEIASLGIVRSFQNLRLFPKLTVLDNVLAAVKDQYGETFIEAAFGYGRKKAEQEKNISKAMDYLDFVNLAEKASVLAEDLSYGEQKFVSIARLLASEGDFLLLDEPVSGLHPAEIEIVLEKIKDMIIKGKTILLVEHNMEAVMAISDRVIVLDEGSVIASGKPGEIQENKEVIEVYLGA